MQRAVLRITRSPPTKCCSIAPLGLRPFSTSSRLLLPSSVDAARKYIGNLYRATRNPLWHLLDTLPARSDAEDGAAAHVYLYNALHDNRVSIEEFRKWEPVLSLPDIDAAVVTLHELGYQVAELSDSEPENGTGITPRKPIPSWIVLCLVQYKVKTPEQASGALMDLVFSHLPSAPADVKAPLLILTTYQLARFNLLLPIRRVLAAFQALDNPTPTTTSSSSQSHPQPPPHSRSREHQYNALLHALSTLPLRAVETTNNVHLLLRRMDSHHPPLRLRSSTYDALLQNRSTTFLLAKSLFVRMVQEGRTPTAYQLEALLRIFTEQGPRELAVRFWETVHVVAGGAGNEEGKGDEKGNEKGSAEAPAPGWAVSDPGGTLRMRANTLMLNSFETRKKASKFLRRLVEETDISASENPESLNTTSAPSEEQEQSNTPTSTDAAPTPQSPSYTHTAAFHVASKDLSASTQRLLEIFHALPGAPSLVSYTILLRGLLRRREFRRAEVVWGRVERGIKRGGGAGAGAGGGRGEGKGGNGWAMDQEALAVGLQVLTRAGKPHEAFQLLERYALRPPDVSSAKAPKLQLKKEDGSSELSNETNAQTQTDSDPDPDRPTPRIQLTTITMNEFLVALNRISRPDVVFRLFEHMSTLYSVQPSAASLDILLQSARLAVKMDAAFSFSSSLALAKTKLKALNPFKSLKKYKMAKQEHRRIRAVDEVISCVGHPSRGELRRYVDGRYQGLEPDEYARGVFLRVLFGVEAVSPLPGGVKLKDIESPARATRQAYDSDPSDTSPLSLPSLHLQKYVFTPPPPSFPLFLPPTNTKPKPYYPSLIPTNRTFLSYLSLLGVASRAPEVPLTLAWMRALGVQPSESTLALALVLWFEVSTHAPLVERWAGGEEGGEFGRLRGWVEAWVGEGRVPSREVMGRWRGVVQRMREGRR